MSSYFQRPKMQGDDMPWLLHSIWKCSKQPLSMTFSTRDPDLLYDFAWPKMLKYYFAADAKYSSKIIDREIKWRNVFATIKRDEWKDAIEAKLKQPATKKSSQHGMTLEGAKGKGKSSKREHSSEDEFDSEGDSDSVTPKKKSKSNSERVMSHKQLKPRQLLFPAVKEKTPAEIYPVVMSTKIGTWAEKCGFKDVGPFGKLTVGGYETHGREKHETWLGMFEDDGLTQEMLNMLDIEIESASKLSKLDSLLDSNSKFHT